MSPATAGPARGAGLDIRDFGATADGDARTAIQAATDAAARGEGDGVVFIPPGTWTFRSKDRAGRIITPPWDTPIVYRGIAGASVLTAADGMREWDGFRTDGPGAVSFDDLVFDGNAAANLQPRGAGHLQSWIYFDMCRTLTMRRIHFRNHAGARCVSVGNGTAGTRTAGDVDIREVSARDVGSAVAGNVHLGDHSTFWINSERLTIADCSVDNDRHGAYDTFVEAHSSNAIVRANRIRNVRIGVIIAALFNDQTDAQYLDNIMHDVDAAYRVYVMNGMRLDATVRGGTVRHTGLHPLFDTSDCIDAADRIAFHDVVADGAGARGGDAPAFTIGKVRRLEVRGGTVRGIGGPVLSLSTHRPAGDGVAAVLLRGLTAIDCGGAAGGEGVSLHPARDGETLRDVAIEDCTFRNTAPGRPMRVAIAGSIDVTGTVAVRGNAFDGVEPGCAWAADARVGRIDLDVVDPDGRTFDPVRAGVRADRGSRWVAAAAATTWDKRAVTSPASAAGWVRTVTVTDGRLPDSGEWRVGDRVLNLPAGGRPRAVHGLPGARYVVEYWEVWRPGTLRPGDDPASIFAERRLYTGTGTPPA